MLGTIGTVAGYRSQVRGKPAQVNVLGLLMIQGFAVALMMIMAALYVAFRLDPSPALGLGPEQLIYPVCWLVIGVFAWSFWSWRRMSGTWFDPYTLFLLSAVLFNGGQVFLEIFRLNDGGILAGRFSYDTTIYAVFLVGVGMATLHLGVLISAIRKRPRGAEELGGSEGQDGTKDLRWVGLFLLTISIVPMTMIMWRAVVLVLQGGYFALYQQEAGIGLMAGPQVLASFFVPASLFVLAANRGSRRWVIASGLLILVVSAMAMFMGARYVAVAPLIAYAWVWHRCRRRLSGTVLVGIGAAVLLVILPLVGSVRNVAGTERSSVAFLVDAYFSLENPSIAAISEMGGTLKILAHTVELVPWVRPFEYGAEYLYAALTVFPNIFWDVHPSVARGTASDWLIRTVNPVAAASGGGLGFSFVAEAFLNFGFSGVLIVPFFMGLLYGRFVAWGSWTSDPAKIATLASYLSFFLVYARSDSTSVVRPLIWYTFLPYVLILCLRYYRRRLA